MTRFTTLSRRLLAIGAAVGLGLTLLPAAPAAAATPRIPGSFFGMHDGDAVSFPAAPVGAVRLWDSGVSWREIETAPGRFDFTRVDAQVNAARAHGASVLLVLGQTPRFHSTKPGQRGSYGLGAAADAHRDVLEELRLCGGQALQGTGRRLPGVERGQRRGLLAGHPEADGHPDATGLDGRQPQRRVGEGRVAGDGDPPVQPAVVAAHVLRAEDRRQEGLGLRRRGLPQPLPAREPEARGVDDAAGSDPHHASGRRRAEAHLEHRDQLRSRSAAARRRRSRRTPRRPTSVARSC